MNCWHCNHELIWGGDHDYEDYQMEGEGIVTNLSCPECDAMVLVYSGDRQTDLPIKNEAAQNPTHKQRGESPPSAQPIKEWFQPGLIKKLPIPSNWKRRN